MPAIEIPKEKWNGKVREITLGATNTDGGTRTKTVTVGGEISGNWEMGVTCIDTSPASTMTMEMTDAKTGRSMKKLGPMGEP